MLESQAKRTRFLFLPSHELENREMGVGKSEWEQSMCCDDISVFETIPHDRQVFQASITAIIQGKIPDRENIDREIFGRKVGCKIPIESLTGPNRMFIKHSGIVKIPGCFRF